MEDKPSIKFDGGVSITNRDGTNANIHTDADGNIFINGNPFGDDDAFIHQHTVAQPDQNPYVYSHSHLYTDAHEHPIVNSDTNTVNAGEVLPPA